MKVQAAARLRYFYNLDVNTIQSSSGPNVSTKCQRFENCYRILIELLAIRNVAIKFDLSLTLHKLQAHQKLVKSFSVTRK